MIYLHVPFCESRCTYCGFYSNVISNVILSEAKNLCYEAYADAVCAEVTARREEIARTLEVNTLYIGGGTPSVLPLDVLSRIVRTIESLFTPSEAVVHPSGRGMPAEPVAARGHMNGWLAAGETGRSAKREGFGGIAPSGTDDRRFEEMDDSG